MSSEGDRWAKYRSAYEQPKRRQGRERTPPTPTERHAGGIGDTIDILIWIDDLLSIGGGGVSVFGGIWMDSTAAKVLVVALGAGLLTLGLILRRMHNARRKDEWAPPDGIWRSGERR